MNFYVTLLVFISFAYFSAASGNRIHFLTAKYDSFKVTNKRAIQKSHEKPRVQKLKEAFLGKESYDQQGSLVSLINTVAKQYLSDCTTVILYDNHTLNEDRGLLTRLLEKYPLIFSHGIIYKNEQTLDLIRNRQNCVNFILFIKDVMKCQEVVGKRHEKVVVVSKSSPWRVQEFFSSENSQDILNLLVIIKTDKEINKKDEAPYILYTHKLFTDGLGSSKPVVLTSWYKGNFTRIVPLFPRKLLDGVSGHRFIVSAGDQPPFVIKKKNTNGENQFEGIEISLVELLSQMYNFTTDYREPIDSKINGSSEAVIKTIRGGSINLGIAGLFITEDRHGAGNFLWHSEDCASFISLTSTALPRYRAIMGPFRWEVWLALTAVYLFAILLFTYSDRFTLRHLLENPAEIENTFWYVFGTFTNCFSFVGRYSWTKAEKMTTKLLIAMYWLFTIIITACYTGSIIAFVTIPVFPSVVDTIYELLAGRFDIGMLDKGGWPNWYQNLSDKKSRELLEDVDYVPDVASGLKNVTQAFFWRYAFLGSREQLKYIVKTNFTVENRQSALHIGSQCFATYKIGLLLPKHSVYQEIISRGIQLITETGLLKKIKNDVEWNNYRSTTGKLLAVNSRGLRTLSAEDRALTLDDTQGMFLLLALGFLIGGVALLSEWFGGCFNICRKRRNTSANSSIPSNPRTHERRDSRRISWNSQNVEHKALRMGSPQPSGIPKLKEPFGEIVDHYDHHFYNQIIINHQNNDEDDSDEIDYNEEIMKIFEQALGSENSVDNSYISQRLDANISTENQEEIEQVSQEIFEENSTC